MNRSLFLATALCLVLGACDRNRTETTSTSTGTEGLSSVQDPSAMGAQANEKVLNDIRQSLISDTTLSESARHISVVEENGTITLRGQVEDPDEMNRVLNLVQTTAGTSNINNQLSMNDTEEFGTEGGTGSGMGGPAEEGSAPVDNIPERDDLPTNTSPISPNSNTGGDTDPLSGEGGGVY